MKNITLLVLLGICALSLAKPANILNVSGDGFRMHQDVDDDDDDIITGTYSWTSPEGREYYVTYIADDDGFRVVDSNAIPVSSLGVRADGAQGSFLASEYDLDDVSDSDDFHDSHSRDEDDFYDSRSHDEDDFFDDK